MRCVDEDEPAPGRDQIRTDDLRADVVNVVEYLERIDLLLAYWRGPPGFAPRRFHVPFSFWPERPTAAAVAGETGDSHSDSRRCCSWYESRAGLDRITGGRRDHR